MSKFRRQTIRTTEFAKWTIVTGRLITPDMPCDLPACATFQLPRGNRTRGHVETAVEYFSTEAEALQAHEYLVATLQAEDGTDVPLVSSWPLISEDRAPADCADCGVDTRAIDESHMIRNDIWAQAWAGRVQPRPALLCIGCLEKRIGRIDPRRFYRCDAQ